MSLSSFTRTAVLTVAGAAAVVVLPLAAAGTAAADLGTLSGCAGKTFFASSDNQTLHGTCGDDVFKVGKYQGVTVYGYGGNDDVRAGFNHGTTTAYLGDGNDEIHAGAEKTIKAFGEGGNDTMEGGNGDDWIDGGAGNDTIIDSYGANTLLGGTGDDHFDSRSWGPKKVDALNGGTGTDTAEIDGAIDQTTAVEHVIKY